MSDPTPPTDARAAIQALLERHAASDHSLDTVGDRAYCRECGDYWPCDAHRMATALLAAVGALGSIGNMADPTIKWAFDLRTEACDALATIAQTLDGEAG